MIPYDITFDPPAPVLDATVSNVRNRRLRRAYPALLDTGGDITAIPIECERYLKLYPVNELFIEGIRGAGVTIHVFAVRLSFASLEIPRLEVILTPLKLVVIGRDLLNRYNIHLYGPQQAFEMNT